MKKENFKFKSFDGKGIFVNSWLINEESEPKGVIQLIHGMSEHSLRYENFAKYFTSLGFYIYADDHRGHGKTAYDYELGHLGVGELEKVIKDEYELSKIIRKKHSKLPKFIIGHSMGSFITRLYLAKYKSNIEGAVICGTAGPSIIYQFLNLIIKFRLLLNKEKKQDKFMNKIIFGTYNKKINSKKTNFDWLCDNELIVNKYINDNLCGFIPTTGFFNELIRSLIEIHRKENINQINKSLPLLIIAGDEDPVGTYGKGPKKVYESYKKSGIKNTEIKLYNKGRHEILNEKFNQTVYKDIHDWLERQIL